MPEFGVSNLGDIGPATPDNSISALSRESGHGTLTAAATWALCAPRLAARDWVRLARSGKKVGFEGRREIALTARLPALVAAVYIYFHGLTKLLVLDFDVKRARTAGAADPAGLVEEELADAAALIAACGGECFSDVSPTGGRHLYVLWSANRPSGPMKRLVLALERRYRSLDPSPMLNEREGLIIPPGAWVGGSGFRRLTDDPAYVDWVLDHPNGPEVWSRLLDALRPELEELERTSVREAAVAGPAVASTAGPGIPAQQAHAAAAWAIVPDEDGVSMWRRPDGRRLPRLSRLMEAIARTGQYELGAGNGRYRSNSEARQAVLAAAVSCGWRLADVAVEMRRGAWPGLVSFYARYRDDQARLSRLRKDWERAALWIAGRESGREIHTRRRTHGGVQEVVVEGLPILLKPRTSPMELPVVWEYTQRWHSAFRAAEKQRWCGQAGITKRRVLLAMLKAAQLSHSILVDFGCREIALLAGLDHSTVAKALRQLRDENDPFIDLVQPHHHDQADIYRLVIPLGYTEAAAWRTPQYGRLGGIHPVFRILGGPAAFLYEQLTDTPTSSFDLAGLAGVSLTAAKTGLRTLAEEGMAVRERSGWVRGSEDPKKVADRVGVPELVEAIVARYRKERDAWRLYLEQMEARRDIPVVEPPEHPVPLQRIADEGPPPWMKAEPHGPPVLVGAADIS
ncbi:hypothetical protein [Streptosporangium sp. NPDC051022]|uniref:hypothetical protein n=1 Tax=Streptosporangium sp. NPDC051022 TaxID=3155752 RepID=UPI00342ACBC3